MMSLTCIHMPHKCSASRFRLGYADQVEILKMILNLLYSLSQLLPNPPPSLQQSRGTIWRTCHRSIIATGGGRDVNRPFHTQLSLHHLHQHPQHCWCGTDRSVTPYFNSSNQRSNSGPTWSGYSTLLSLRLRGANLHLRHFTRGCKQPHGVLEVSASWGEHEKQSTPNWNPPRSRAQPEVCS